METGEVIFQKYKGLTLWGLQPQASDSGPWDQRELSLERMCTHLPASFAWYLLNVPALRQLPQLWHLPPGPYSSLALPLAPGAGLVLPSLGDSPYGSPLRTLPWTCVGWALPEASLLKL